MLTAAPGVPASLLLNAARGVSASLLLNAARWCVYHGSLNMLQLPAYIASQRL